MGHELWAFYVWPAIVAAVVGLGGLWLTCRG
jgi:heme exporter protein D